MFTCFCFTALMKPKVNVKCTSPDSTGNKMLRISCSVTGRPAAVITWKFPEYLQIKPVQYVTYHPNQTVTVVSNFTHMSSKDLWKNPVSCVIQHPSLNTTQELTLSENGVEQGECKCECFLFKYMAGVQDSLQQWPGVPKQTFELSKSGVSLHWFAVSAAGVSLAFPMHQCPLPCLHY